MVRNDEQRGGLGKRRILGKKCRVHMAVRADEGEIPHLRIEFPRDAPNGRIGVEESVGVQLEGRAWMGAGLRAGWIHRTRHHATRE